MNRTASLPWHAPSGKRLPWPCFFEDDVSRAAVFHASDVDRVARTMERKKEVGLLYLGLCGRRKKPRRAYQNR